MGEESLCVFCHHYSISIKRLLQLRGNIMINNLSCPKRKVVFIGGNLQILDRTGLRKALMTLEIGSGADGAPGLGKLPGVVAFLV